MQTGDFSFGRFCTSRKTDHEMKHRQRLSLHHERVWSVYSTNQLSGGHTVSFVIIRDYRVQSRLLINQSYAGQQQNFASFMEGSTGICRNIPDDRGMQRHFLTKAIGHTDRPDYHKYKYVSSAQVNPREGTIELRILTIASSLRNGCPSLRDPRSGSTKNM